MRRRRWKRILPEHPCTCGVKRANYATFLGLRCARCARRLREAAMALHPELKHEQVYGIGHPGTIPPTTLDDLTKRLI